MAVYPKKWERHLTLQDGTAIFVRPVRPEDEQLYIRFLSAETAEDLRRRFFAAVKHFNHAFIAPLTNVDYVKAMAFIALDEAKGEIVGAARLHATDGTGSGEYAILVRSDRKGRGLGWQLMQTLIAYARTRSYRCIRGQVLHENVKMLDMCRELGFDVKTDPDEPYICDVKLSL